MSTNESHSTFIDETIDKIKKPEPIGQAGKFGMTIVYERPPVWEGVMLHFKINVDSTLFTYGDVIYNPPRVWIPDDYIFHESIHAGQQGHSEEGAAKWWTRYLQDGYFRIDQEAKAYAAQYDFWCKTNKDRNARNRKFIALAETLCSPMYGNMIGYEQACKLIKLNSKTK